MTLRISTAEIEGELRVSRWLELRFLIDEVEMERLFSDLDPFHIFVTSDVVEAGAEEQKKEKFLEAYAEYIQSLKNGLVPDTASFRSYFYNVFSVDLNSLFRMDLGDQLSLVKPRLPVIQMQPHQFEYSKTKESFRSMSLGQNCIVWGIQLAYPQMHQTKDGVVHRVLHSDNYPNNRLFKSLQKWIRRNTVPLTFEVDGKKVSSSLRLGPNCFSWIDKHPQLEANRLSIIRNTP